MEKAPSELLRDSHSTQTRTSPEIARRGALGWNGKPSKVHLGAATCTPRRALVAPTVGSSDRWMVVENFVEPHINIL